MRYSGHLKLLLQCKIHGKAEEAIAALPVEDSLSYDLVKAAILCAYELVPEAYRQKFRSHKKATGQSYLEFAREKWSTACKACDFESVRELILLEDFKKCLPECIVVYINEQKVSKLSSAAVLVDEFVMTHRTIFSSGSDKKFHVKTFPLFTLRKKIGSVFIVTSRDIQYNLQLFILKT